MKAVIFCMDGSVIADVLDLTWSEQGIWTSIKDKKGRFFIPYTNIKFVRVENDTI